jgi:diadenosine tetraphosphate (Ap4A) HIT family hydrolase
MSEKLDNCAFCNITSEPERVIRVGRYVTSFLSNPRLVKGHALIVPNRHITSVLDLCYEEMEEMGFETERIGELLLASLADGIDTWTKYRPLVPENQIKANHMHLHILPSRKDDAIYSTGVIWNAENFTELTPEERDETIKLLRIVES